MSNRNAIFSYYTGMSCVKIMNTVETAIRDYQESVTNGRTDRR